ncbi:uncharacterized protein LOC129288886 [Prosopis cineraria]|uniref:uncharacterized protein LOC129288886 n=1 Tax=Prosopis cineraria TaxID=364024 RepID=UPI00240F276B|nr:uncharacterized protein LOC129288886 [Prosopis cineraria]
MEGLIPFVYKAIMQYRNGKEGAIGSWLCESPSYSYVRLAAGDSGRFQTSASVLLSDYGFSATAPPAKSSSPSNNSSSSATQFPIQSSSGVHQSPNPALKRREVSA